MLLEQGDRIYGIAIGAVVVILSLIGCMMWEMPKPVSASVAPVAKAAPGVDIAAALARDSDPQDAPKEKIGEKIAKRIDQKIGEKIAKRIDQKIAAKPISTGALTASDRSSTRPDVRPDNAAIQRLPVGFAVGSAKPIRAKVERLVDIARQFGTCAGRIVLIGHADSTGDPRENVTLSKQRATAVRAMLEPYLPEKARVEVRGVGSAQPALPRKTARARRVNRRVTISCEAES